MSSHDSLPRPEMNTDVAILGGGICGLTLALQLRLANPDARIVIVELQPHPVRESAHKVGESSVEVQAHYLRRVLGLEDHLEAEHVRKFGLRMFMPNQGNTDIARRVEFGQIEDAPLPAYQLDRGRLENYLAKLVSEKGVEFLDGHRVTDVQLGTGQRMHTVHVEGPGASVVTARWVVDATGRAGLLKRQLRLQQPNGHHASSSWMRVNTTIDVGAWSDNPAWCSRVPSGLRRLSTNHLMGEGYWVWLIPLANGVTSVGIVADDDAHPHSTFNTLDRALDWIRRHEPQLGNALDEAREDILDFRVMRDYSYGATQVYNGQDRWCLTGEAGVAIDPLYSAGGDLMAISNGLITDLITRDLSGEEIETAAVAFDQIYLLMAQIWLIAYKDQYRTFGNPRVMVAKVVWDTIIYWAVPGLLYFHDAYRRMDAIPFALPALYRTWELHTRVQQFFREWAKLDTEGSSDTFADPYSLLDFLVDLHTGMDAGLDDTGLGRQLTTNVALLEQLAGQLITVVTKRVQSFNTAESAEIQHWAQDHLLGELRARYEAAQLTNPIDPSWISLGAQDHAVEECA